MSGHNRFYYPYASFTNEQVPLLKVAALYFDKLIILNSGGASWATAGADHFARDAITLLNSGGILEVVTPADVLAKYTGPHAAAWPTASFSSSAPPKPKLLASSAGPCCSRKSRSNCRPTRPCAT